jgi:hypothetical protein
MPFSVVCEKVARATVLGEMKLYRSFGNGFCRSVRLVLNLMEAVTNVDSKDLSARS